MVLAALLALALVALGVAIGLRSPWGTQHPHVYSGVAMRANSDNDLILFDADDGQTQLTLHADALWWESSRAGGEGDPPCLRKPGRKVDVRVGAMRVARPGGGWFQHAMWVVCP